VIDVFVRYWPQSRLRKHLAQAVLERLSMQDDARVRLLVPGACGYEYNLPPFDTFDRISAARFAAESRERADVTARSPIYVVIDDDHLPIGKGWIRAGVRALEQRPDFAMLSAWSVNGEVRDHGGVDPDVFEAHSCGTPCFVRKGTFAKLPEGPAPEYDLILSEHLKANVGKIGFLRNVRFNHLGFELSQVVPGHWSA